MGLECRIWIAKLKNRQHSSLAIKCFYCLKDRTDFSHQCNSNSSLTKIRPQEEAELHSLWSTSKEKQECQLYVEEKRDWWGKHFFTQPWRALISLRATGSSRRTAEGHRHLSRCMAAVAQRHGGPKQSAHMSWVRIDPGVMDSNPRRTWRARHKADGFTCWDEMRGWPCVCLRKQCLCNADAQELLRSPNAFFGAPVTTRFKHFNSVETLETRQETLKAKICFKVIYIYPFRHI